MDLVRKTIDAKAEAEAALTTFFDLAYAAGFRSACEELALRLGRGEKLTGIQAWLRSEAERD